MQPLLLSGRLVEAQEGEQGAGVAGRQVERPVLGQPVGRQRGGGGPGAAQEIGPVEQIGEVDEPPYHRPDAGDASGWQPGHPRDGIGEDLAHRRAGVLRVRCGSGDPGEGAEEHGDADRAVVQGRADGADHKAAGSVRDHRCHPGERRVASAHGDSEQRGGDSLGLCDCSPCVERRRLCRLLLGRLPRRLPARLIVFRGGGDPRVEGRLDQPDVIGQRRRGHPRARDREPRSGPQRAQGWGDAIDAHGDARHVEPLQRLALGARQRPFGRRLGAGGRRRVQAVEHDTARGAVREGLGVHRCHQDGAVGGGGARQHGAPRSR